VLRDTPICGRLLWSSIGAVEGMDRSESPLAQLAFCLAECIQRRGQGIQQAGERKSCDIGESEETFKDKCNPTTWLKVELLGPVRCVEVKRAQHISPDVIRRPSEQKQRRPRPRIPLKSEDNVFEPTSLKELLW